MKKTILSFGLISCLFFTGNAQWLTITSGITAKLDAIHFIDSQNGYCSGGFTNTLETTDGGNNWKKGSSQGFRDFGFYNNTYGYGASIGVISMAKTTNGGLSWTSITPPTSNSLWAVSATSSTTAYFVGTGGVLWKTINGGSTVTIGNSGTTDLLTDIVFTNTTTGFLVVQTGEIKKTTNSGTSWSTVHTVTSNLLTEMFFVDNNVGYVIGGGGTVVKTTDGGQNWTTLTTNSTSYLQGINFFNANNGIVVGTAGTILYTNDGGTTWSSQNSGTTEDLFDVSMLSTTSAIVTGDNGTILKNNNIIFGIENKILSIDIMLYPNPVADKLTLELPQTSKQSTITIYNINGAELIKQQAITNKTQIDISTLPSGIYFVKLITDKTVEVRKIIKE
ncbi:MAG: YCF48-related protein [Bacteroidales bacterium]|jgi:photosystem II stability/assembly factor-like uncharacterized protein